LSEAQRATWQPSGYGGAMPDWDPEVEIDEPLVRALLDEQFPELATRPVRFVGKGWDNSVWVVDEEWTFRLPRRQIAIPGVERELAILPRVAPLVPVSVPVPTLVGSANERFPWPFFAYRPLPGAEPADAELSDDERVRFAAQLAGFLRALHAPETRDVVDPGGALPIDFNLRADMSVRVPRARENLAYLRESRLLLAHGDLHLRHVLVAEGALAGVIDWGDVCLADPCIDLILVWSLLTPPARERFFADYGPVSEERRIRSRVLAINLDSMLARYAHDTGHASLQREAIAALELTLLE
jgi:aminoglycoside phosphotransferase (APT) family kinase protein